MFGFYLRLPQILLEVHREVLIKSYLLPSSLFFLLTADMPPMITAGPSMVGVPPPGAMVPPGMMPGAPTAFPGQQPGFYGQY